MRGGHGGQVEIFEALGVAGDDEVGSRLEGGEILHGIFKVGGTGVLSFRPLLPHLIGFFFNVDFYG